MKIEDLSDKELQKYYNLYKMGINKTKRFESHKIFNLDVKFAYHLIRLLDEVEQILSEGDLDLERNREQLKYIRNGFYTENEIIKLAQDKEKALEIVNSKSTAVPYKIQHRKIRNLLWECLEIHFQDNELKPKDKDKYYKILIDIKEKIENNIG